jgi:hypothetical protein
MSSTSTTKIDGRTFHQKMGEAYNKGDALAVLKYASYLGRRLFDDSDLRKSTTAAERVAMAKDICKAVTDISPAIAAMPDIRDPSDTGGYAALRSENDALKAKNEALEARLAALEAAVAASAAPAAAPKPKKAAPVATATVIPAAPAAPAPAKPVGLFAGFTAR